LSADHPKLVRSALAPLRHRQAVVQGFERPNERVAFYVTESTIPNLTKFAEDYVVERVGSNETRLTWTVAIENTGFMRYLNPITRLVLKPVFQSWFRRYKKLLEATAETAPQPTAAAQPRA